MSSPSKDLPERPLLSPTSDCFPSMPTTALATLLSLASIAKKPIAQSLLNRCILFSAFSSDSTSCAGFRHVKFDAFYIDPARRNSENKRLYDLRDCEPDIIELQSILLKKAPVILLKASPMIDISRAIQDLKFVKEVHVISVKNECKELFFIINNHFSEDEISINCVNLSPVQQPENYIFTLENEKNLPLLQSVTSIQSYLYEPNSSILKAGAFKSVAISFSISKIRPGKSVISLLDVYK